MMAGEIQNSSGDKWSVWSNHVLNELKRVADHCEKLSSDLGTIKTEIAMLKVKAGLWGALGACVPTVLAVIFIIFKK